MSSFSRSQRGAAFLLLLVPPLAACGEDAVPPKPVPAPEVVRDVYGLGDKSCWKYKYSQGGTNLFGSMSTAGPNTTAIAGRSVYVRSFRLESGGLPTEDYFDTDSKGEIRLLRHVEGRDSMSRISSRYENDANPPLFVRFIVDRVMGAAINLGNPFDTMPTPLVSYGICTPENAAQICTIPGTMCDATMPGQTGACSGMLAEHHLWTPLAFSEMVTTPDGPKVAYKMQYDRTTNDQTKTAVYYVVPGYGIAKFIDFDQTTYQVCASRVCDSAGTCTGAPSCNPTDLVCQ